MYHHSVGGYNRLVVVATGASGGRSEMETRDPKRLSWTQLSPWIGWMVICLSSGLMAATIFLPHG